jgi:hypothetical protein
MGSRNPLGGALRRAGPGRKLRGRTILAVLGMHRSGTSAVAGILADHGIEFGPIREKSRFNRRGNREIPALNELHDRVLERSGGSWWDPPASIRVRRADLRGRDEILASIPGETIAVKDPRMLVCRDLWADLDLKPIGVIRNPLSVSMSLARRARERPRHPRNSARQWEELWVSYNRELLAEHRRREFPVVDFDRHDELDAQVAGALSFWGLETAQDSGFFEPELIGESANADWRSQIESAETLALWDELAALAGRTLSA